MLISRQDKINYIKQHFAEDATTGLEISPSINPMIKSSDGYKIHYLDACTTDELKRRAISKGRNIDCAPSIDYVYDFSKAISDNVGHKTFDFIVSSHVIEHIPDLVSHFQQIEEALKEGGVYGFLAPDKDLCFDAEKPDSTLSQLIEAHVEKRTVAPISAIIDEYHFAVRRAGKGAWTEDDQAPYRAKYPNAKKLITNLIRDPKIAHDWHGHIWRFTPQVFKKLFLELKILDLVRLSLCEVIPTNQMEFIVILKK